MKRTEKKTNERKTVKMPEMKDFPSIRKGDKGGYVTVAQTNLKNRGYDIGKGGVDGVFGEELKRAVKEFQKDIGMPVPNGSIGPKTWAALQESKVNRLVLPPDESVKPVAPPVRTAPVPVAPVPSATLNYQVLISGLSRYQAEMLAKMFGGGMHCEVLA